MPTRGADRPDRHVQITVQSASQPGVLENAGFHRGLRDFTTFFQERPKKRNISNETFGLQTQSEPFNLRSGLSDDVTPLDFATPFYTRTGNSQTGNGH